MASNNFALSMFRPKPIYSLNPTGESGSDQADSESSTENSTGTQNPQQSSKNLSVSPSRLGDTDARLSSQTMHSPPPKRPSILVKTHSAQDVKRPNGHIPLNGSSCEAGNSFRRRRALTSLDTQTIHCRFSDGEGEENGGEKPATNSGTAYANVTGFVKLNVGGNVFIISKGSILKRPEETRLHRLVHAILEHSLRTGDAKRKPTNCLETSLGDNKPNHERSVPIITVDDEPSSRIVKIHEGCEMQEEVTSVSNQAIFVERVVKIVDEYWSDTETFFFDRCASMFKIIATYYRTGFLHKPESMCSIIFRNELSYWGIDHAYLMNCCETARLLKHLSDTYVSKMKLESKTKSSDHTFNASVAKQYRCGAEIRKKIWKGLELPWSSKFALTYAIASVIVVIISVAMTILETLPSLSVVNCQSIPELTQYYNVTKNFEEHSKDLEYEAILNIAPDSYNQMLADHLEYCYQAQLIKAFQVFSLFFMLWFTIDYIVRILTSPRVCVFIFSPLGLVDLLSVFPLFIEIFMDREAVMDIMHSRSTSKYNLPFRVIRFFRLLRIVMVFKLARFSTGLRLMALVLRYSISALSLILLYGAIYIIIFATILFFLESDEKDSKFISIPASCWWAVVTLTTLGYGDMVPTTSLGKLVGAIATIISILILAFPVSIVVDNMKKAYNQIHIESKRTKRIHFKKPSYLRNLHWSRSVSNFSDLGMSLLLRRPVMSDLNETGNTVNTDSGVITTEYQHDSLTRTSTRASSISNVYQNLSKSSSFSDDLPTPDINSTATFRDLSSQLAAIEEIHSDEGEMSNPKTAAPKDSVDKDRKLSERFGKMAINVGGTFRHKLSDLTPFSKVSPAALPTSEIFTPEDTKNKDGRESSKFDGTDINDEVRLSTESKFLPGELHVKAENITTGQNMGSPKLSTNKADKKSTVIIPTSQWLEQNKTAGDK